MFEGGVSMQRRVSVTSRFYLFLIAFMLISFCASYAVAQVHYHRASERLAGLTDQKVTLTNRVHELSARLDYVRTDAYIERVARDELNMIRPGEIRYVSN